MKKKKFLNEIEEKRWFEGWVVLMADEYGEKRVAQEEKRKRGKKKKSYGQETGHSKWGPPCQYIYGNAIENRVMETKNS